MRKSIKIFTTLLIIGILILPTVVLAKINIPAATSEFYVNDFASVFSSSEKARLMEKAVALSDECDGIQVVVSTVKSLDGNEIEDYSYEMYNQYGIGKNDMGLLILLSTGDRKIRVEVGKSMEAYMNDSKAGRFIDQYAIPSLRENNFNKGLIKLQSALISEIEKSIGNENPKENTSTNAEDKSILLNGVGIFLIILAIIVFLIFIIFLVYKIKARIIAKREEIEELNAKIEQLEKEKTRNKEIANNNENFLKSEIQRLTNKNNKLKNDCHKLKSNYDTLKDRYERATKLYPTVDSEITSAIEEEIRQKDISEAKRVDSIINAVITLSASKDIVSKISHAKNEYSNLTKKQKSYVESDISKLNRLYDESLKLEEEYDRKVKEEKNMKLAKEAAVEITAIIGSISIGRAQHLSRLKKAKSIYEDLSTDAREYFDKSILDKLNKLYKQAKRDKEEEEEEERRRRRNSYHHSSSSFGSSSHHGGSSGFGGFGGSSGGGGASRGF